MSKLMRLFLALFLVFLISIACATSGGPGVGPPNQEPSEGPEATQMPIPTATQALVITGEAPLPTEEVQTVYIDLNTVYAEVVAGLPQGSALFNPPEEMKLGKEYLVEVRVVPVTGEELEEDQEIIATLTVGMEDDRPVILIPLKVSTVMSGSLTGEGFSITPLSQEEQIRTSDQPYVSWKWEVRPEKTGEQRLTLHLSVVVNAEGLGDKVHTTSEVREVDVSGNIYFSLGRFMNSNWEWVVTGVMLPFLGWGFGKVWGRVKGGK